jgi:hypothetical protein
MQVGLTALLVIVVIASAWAAFAVAYGSLSIFEVGVISVLAALLFTALTIGFLVASWWIFQWQTTFTGVVLKIIWFFALIFGFYAAWVGNKNLLASDGLTAGQTFLLIGLTVMVIGSPIVLSWIWGRSRQANP